MISRIYTLLSLFFLFSYSIFSDSFGPLADEKKYVGNIKSNYSIEIGQSYGNLRYITRNNEDRTLLFLTGNSFFYNNILYKSIINNNISFQAPIFNLSYWISDNFSIDIGIINFNLPRIDGNFNSPIIGGKYFLSKFYNIFLSLNLGQFSNNSFGNSGKINMGKIGIGYRYDFNENYYIDGILSYYNFRPTGAGFQYQYFEAEGHGVDLKIGYKFELTKK